MNCVLIPYYRITLKKKCPSSKWTKIITTNPNKPIAWWGTVRIVKSNRNQGFQGLGIICALECHLSCNWSHRTAPGEIHRCEGDCWNLRGGGQTREEGPRVVSFGLPCLWTYEVTRHMIKSPAAVMIPPGFKFQFQVFLGEISQTETWVRIIQGELEALYARKQQRY